MQICVDVLDHSSQVNCEWFGTGIGTRTSDEDLEATVAELRLLCEIFIRQLQEAEGVKKDLSRRLKGYEDSNKALDRQLE